MNVIETMKQALEALEWVVYPQQRQKDAVINLRAAIEQMEKREPVAWMADSDEPFFMLPAMHREDDVGFIPLYPAPVAPEDPQCKVCGLFTCECEDPTPDAVTAKPFGYFKGGWDGWISCDETDEGAIPLYEYPAPVAPEYKP